MCIGWMCAIIRCSIALGVLHLIKQLALGSYDLSQAELKVTVVKPEQIHKMKIIFTQKMVKSCNFERKELSFLEFVHLWQQLVSSQL